MSTKAGCLEGKQHGLGWWKWANGNSYYGEWSNDNETRIRRLPLKDGTRHDGAVYVGQFRDGT